MAHITSPRLRIAERIARKLAPKVRRQVGDMARQQIKGISLMPQAVEFANKMGEGTLENAKSCWLSLLCPDSNTVFSVTISVKAISFEKRE